MQIIRYGNKRYHVDDDGFLIDSKKWDEDFAKAMSTDVQIKHGLTAKHWEVIKYIRNTFKDQGKCPLVYQTCQLNGLRLRELKTLFPTGYLRGACKLAGITYKEGYLGHSWMEGPSEEVAASAKEKTYSVDVRGFLVNPDDWDEQFANYKAFEMKITDKLTEQHWRIIHFLRESYEKTRVVPTVYETCEANNLDIEELELLFPDGYHRGAVKIAGLRVR